MVYACARPPIWAFAVLYGCIAVSGLPAKASSILELVGADPFIFPQAPTPTIYFSRDPAHQLTVTVSGTWFNPAPPDAPFGTASVLMLGPETASYVISIEGDTPAPGVSTLDVFGTCANPTTPPSTSPITASGFVVAEPHSDQIFTQPAAGHLSWTLSGSYCGDMLKSGEQDTFARTVQSKGSDGILLDGHGVVVDQAAQLQFKLRSQVEVFVKRTQGTYHSLTAVCIPGTGGGPDTCLREIVCDGILTADGNMSVDGAEIVVGEGGTIQFDATCTDDVVPLTTPG